ncbi:hypothetical protein JW898_03750 [Candidatus Woesearchaeota archaeon]|nr:hypothetical protein [Candidatus Woesearchaeota archaeon]
MGVEKKLMLQDVGGKIYFVDFKKHHFFGKNVAEISDEAGRPIGLITNVGDKPEVGLIEQKCPSEGEIRNSRGKKIFFHNAPKSKADAIYTRGTEPVARVYERVT